MKLNGSINQSYIRQLPKKYFTHFSVEFMRIKTPGEYKFYCIVLWSSKTYQLIILENGISHLQN